jgi:putative colanic acid biosynthesis acetyltransferase WcaF
MKTDLSRFTKGEFVAGAKWKVLSWYFINYLILNSDIPWPYIFKRRLLLLYGARVGKGLVIKTRVRIKYPWKLTIRDHCWIGEDVWIDNLEEVFIGSNVCISQGALLLTGNHDYTVSHFPYRLGKIMIEDGVWIGAKSVVCPGVNCRAHSVLTVNSVAAKEMEEMTIYSGNPAKPIRTRSITS